MKVVAEKIRLDIPVITNVKLPKKVLNRFVLVMSQS